MAASCRYIPNPYPSYNTKGGPYIETQECKQTLKQAREWLKENIIKFESLYPTDLLIPPYTDPRKKSRDVTVYTGLGGNAYVHWKLYHFYSNEGNNDCAVEHLMKGLEAIHNALYFAKEERSLERGVAFYIGMPGLCTVAALLYNDYQEPVKTNTYLTNLLSFLPQVLLPDTPDELLYGRAGYLSCLLMVRRHLPKDILQNVKLNDALRQVFNAIIESGQKGQRSSASKRYLCYYFYGQDYLGAAHGTAGILYMLLQCPIEWCQEPEVQSCITKTLDHLVSMQLPDGNFPTKDYKRSDTNTPVHWCHGSPGVVPCLYQGYKVYGHDGYLASVRKGLECVWKYGLLKKGFGTCHGITGSAYTFLSLYRTTDKEEYYHNALCMGTSVWNDKICEIVKSHKDPQRYAVGQPDAPCSLMEGLGGMIVFFCDLLYPKTAAFPGYE